MNGYSQVGRFAGDDDQGLDALLTHILRVRGLDCSQYKASFIQRRLAVRLRARGVSTYQDYLDILTSDPTEFEPLLVALTINLSYFFRDEAVFEALRLAVLPSLISEQRRAGHKKLAIWSAGCATGEEPYSIALILTELLERDLAAWTVQIHATDVDETALERARQAVYPPTSFRDLQADFVPRYFVRQDGGFRLPDHVRQMVTFRQHDLATQPLSPGYDMILCRNVLIYFTREHQQRIIHHLIRHLNPGGYLVLGMTEMLPMGLTLSGRLEVVDGRLRIYRKPQEEEWVVVESK